jgi:hypothetical protein
MCSTKGFGIVAVLLALVLTFGGMSLACGAKPATVPPPSPPLPAETPTSLPPISTEPEISDNYTTYTDEAKYFSISYPSDWEMALSSFADLEEKAKETISNLKSGLPIESANAIFLAGRRTATGYEPNLNIIVEPVPEGVSTYDQMVDVRVEGAKNAVQDYREFSRVKITVDGREATIIDSEGTPEGQGKLHFLQMYMLVDKTTWVITCTALSEDFTNWENDFHTIVRSLRISNIEQRATH